MTVQFWVWMVGALLAGAVLGVILTLVLGGGRRNDGGEDARELRRELEDYRQEVTDHFIGTAERVNDLTRAYKDVYDHLERGAYRLVGEEKLRSRLEDVRDERITLSTIGRRSELGRVAPAGEDASPLDEPLDEPPDEPVDAPNRDDELPPRNA